MPAFTVVVEDAFTVPGRGALITGVLVDGSLPPVGTTVAVHAEDKPTVLALYSGRPMLPPQPPGRADMLLRGLTKEDVPPGSRITDAPADSSDMPF